MAFTEDGDYYLEKEDVGSLNHGLEYEIASSDVVEATLGLIVNSTIPLPSAAEGHSALARSANVPAAAEAGATITPLRWGRNVGIGPPVSNDISRSEEVIVRSLQDIVCPEFLQLVTGDQQPSSLEGAASSKSKEAMPLRSILVDPWSSPPIVPAPFDLAPAFAEDDERQRRFFNPVRLLSSSATWSDLSSLCELICRVAFFFDTTRLLQRR